MKESQPYEHTHTYAKKPATVADKPDGPKEHFAAIHYLIDQMKAVPKQDGATLDALDKIVHRLDLLEEKPEAVEAEKQRLAKIEADRAEKAKADAAKAKAEA